MQQGLHAEEDEQDERDIVKSQPRQSAEACEPRGKEIHSKKLEEKHAQVGAVSAHYLNARGQRYLCHCSWPITASEGHRWQLLLPGHELAIAMV